MSNGPLVSIIIPTYKRANLLEKSLKSVLDQTYENIEIIIVDDNDPKSEDRISTYKIVNKYLNNYSNIRYIELDKNSGGCVARNKGLEFAKGKYINFLDDDDLFHKDKIKMQVSKFEQSKEKLAVVGCFARIIDDKGNLKRIEKEEIKGNVFIHQLGKNVCTTSIALIDREICIKSGGFIKIPSSQEHLFFIKIFEVNPNYDYVSEVLIDINHHLGERVSTNKNKPLGALALLDYVKTYFNKLEEEDIKQISIEHYENIIRSYISINNKKECIPYFAKIIKNKGVFNKRVLKLFILIILSLHYLPRRNSINK